MTTRSTSSLRRWALAAICLSTVAVTVGVVGHGGSPYFGKFAETYVVDNEAPRSSRGTCAVDATALNATPGDNESLAMWDAIPNVFSGLFDEGSDRAGGCVSRWWSDGAPQAKGPCSRRWRWRTAKRPATAPSCIYMVVTEVARFASTLLDLPTDKSFGTLQGALNDSQTSAWLRTTIRN